MIGAWTFAREGIGTKNIGWFTTARGPGSFNLLSTMLDSIDRGEIQASLSFVYINREVKGNQYRKRLIAMAEARAIPVVTFPSDTFEPELKTRDMEMWREEYGRGLRERISGFRMDFGVLAGYMLIVDPETCRKHTLINLHPALPGTYRGTWEEIVGQVVSNGDERYGATVHICTPELDCGQAIAFDSFPLADLRSRHDTEDELVLAVRAEELRREAHLLMEAIRMLVQEEVRIEGGQALDANGIALLEPLSLAERIDSRLSVRAL